MKNEFRKDAIELYRSGMQPNEIVEQLDVSQASVYRWIKEAEERGDLETQEEDHPEPTETELTDYNSDDNKPPLLIAGKKRRALKKHKKYFKNLRLNVIGCRWAGDDLNDRILEMEEVQDTIEEILEFDESRFENNALWRTLQIFIDRFESLLPVGRQDIDLLFDYTGDRLEEIDKIIAIDEFDQEFDWSAHEILEIEREKCQLMQDILNHEDNDLDVDVTTGLLSRTKELKHKIKAINDQGLYDDTLALLKIITSSLKEVRTEIDEAILWKTGTLKFTPELKDDIEEHCSVNLSLNG